MTARSPPPRIAVPTVPPTAQAYAPRSRPAAVPLVPHHVELADDQGEEVRRVGRLLPPVEGDGLVPPVVLAPDQLAVRDGFEPLGYRDDHLGGLPLVGLVDAREPVPVGR